MENGNITTTSSIELPIHLLPLDLRRQIGRGKKVVAIYIIGKLLKTFEDGLQ